jgi:TolA-binding protein
MNCESCELKLRNLVQGTIENSVAAELRRHLAHCTNCRRRYEQLNRELTEGSSLSQSDLSQTANGCQPNDTRSLTASESDLPWYTAGWPRSISFVGRLAMGRQVAVAAIMLLVVAVGLWYVPQLRQRREVVGSTITHPDYSNSNGSRTSDRLKPAELLDLAIDKRSGRIHPKGSEPPGIANYRRTPLAAVERALTEEPVKAATADGAIEPTYPSQGIEASEIPLQTATIQSATAALTGAQAEADPVAQKDVQTNAQNTGEIEPAASIYLRAMSRYRAGRFEEASKDLTEVTGRDDARELHRRALLYLGRTYRASGQCELAIAQYESLIDRFPATPEAGDAMLEAAACHRQKGDGEQASKLVERASQQRWLTPRAKRELKRLGH